MTGKVLSLHAGQLLNGFKLIIKYPEIGVCGLSCRLCPMYQTQAATKCDGCKSLGRMIVGCPFLTCAVKKKGKEFCWQCKENSTCEKWKNHRETSKRIDSFKCYQKLEADIAFVSEYGLEKFEEEQKERERLLKEMLQEFDEGRSKSYYCIAATVLSMDELKNSVVEAKNRSNNLEGKEKTKVMHMILNLIAKKKGYLLKLIKKEGA